MRLCHVIPAQLQGPPSLPPFKCFPHLIVSVAVKCEPLSVPFTSPPLTFSPLILSTSTAFKLTEFN